MHAILGHTSRQPATIANLPVNSRPLPLPIGRQHGSLGRPRRGIRVHWAEGRVLPSKVEAEDEEIGGLEKLRSFLSGIKTI